MTNFNVPIPDSCVPALEAQARTAGVEPSELIRTIVTRALEQASVGLDDLLLDFRTEVVSSGMTEKELDNLFQDARRAAASR